MKPQEMEDKNTTKCYCGHTTYCDCSPLVSKQTAVDWLQVEIDNKDMGEIPMWIYELIEKAKEMEKEQIIHAWKDKRIVVDKLILDYSSEEYYNETYGKTLNKLDTIKKDGRR